MVTYKWYGPWAVPWKLCLWDWYSWCGLPLSMRLWTRWLPCPLMYILLSSRVWATTGIAAENLAEQCLTTPCWPAAVPPFNPSKWLLPGRAHSSLLSLNLRLSPQTIKGGCHSVGTLHWIVRCYVALHENCIFFYKLRARPSTTKTIMIHFITELAVLQWSQTKPVISPTGACTRFIVVVWNRTCASEVCL